MQLAGGRKIRNSTKRKTSQLFFEASQEGGEAAAIAGFIALRHARAWYPLGKFNSGQPPGGWTVEDGGRLRTRGNPLSGSDSLFFKKGSKPLWPPFGREENLGPVGWAVLQYRAPC